MMTHDHPYFLFSSRLAQAMMRLIGSMGIACIVLSLLSQPLIAQDKTQKNPKTQKTRAQLEKFEHEIAKREASKNALEEQAKNARLDKQSLQMQMVSTGRKIQQVEGTIFRLDDRIQALEALTKEKQTALMASKESMIELIAALQRMGKRPTAISLLRPGEALDTARSAAMLSTILPHIDEKATALRRDITYLADLFRELSNKRFSLKHNLAELAQQNTVLKNLVDKRESEESEARAAARGESLRIARLVRSSKDTRDLLKKLEEESARFLAAQRAIEKKRAKERERQLALRQAAKSSQTTPVKPRPKDIPKRSKTPFTPLPSGAKFTSLKGRMPYPSFGRVITKYGQQDGASKSKGIRLEVRSGSQVISPFEGRVVYAGPFRDYGQLVIIAHKEGYHGLLAGIGRLYTALNQWVLQGEPVGQVSNAGSRTTQLYFELRSQKGPFNPLPWLQK